ncbi:Nse4-domain-containing protein [Lentithecium fluviatile CBS 122367]|uniref:Non-structural maintenance of chromosomes element 4 n=1 Tax=Lentithecium fluviatile CBS 122367 TaxID=1168545 RepID=A0A6G1J7A5_9PLEO|nr:Nse4-domain-containing protein [Lentithecium fluviatile CBS 122367]
MARLNTRTSATPLATRAGTVDSLYRDPTPASQLNRASNARTSSYSVMSPAVSQNSDKENDVPESRDATPRPKGKGLAIPTKRMQRLVTPDSGNANKRRRTGDYSLEPEEPEEPEESDGAEDGMPLYDGEENTGLAMPDDNDDEEEEEEEEGALRYYDPDQSPEERRQISANIRSQHREVIENHDDLIKHGNHLIPDHVKRANLNLGKLKQTTEAAQDARLIVTLTDTAGKQLNASLHGNNAGIGIDVDQFVSRCIYYMKEGRPAGSEEAGPTQSRARRETQRQAEDEEEDDNGEGLEWEFLGRAACFPNNKRPPLPSFLLGPLSVQKRARAVQTRRARSQRQALGPATRPQEVRQEDIKQSENSNLTHLVTSIASRLRNHIIEGAQKVEQEIESLEDADEETEYAAFNRHRVCTTSEGNAAVSLFDFAINPTSFGQTVENLFYISFLIREGNAKVELDEDKLPLLIPAEARTLSDQREHNVEKHQAIFSIDWPTWQALIEAFDIRKPLIPHRIPDEANVRPGGWHG